MTQSSEEARALFVLVVMVVVVGVVGAMVVLELRVRHRASLPDR